MSDPLINRHEQEKLLQWVRATMEAAVRGEPLMEISDAELSDRLRAPHGVFVTLKKGGELRGCIGISSDRCGRMRSPPRSLRRWKTRGSHR